MNKWLWFKVAVGVFFWFWFFYVTAKYNMDECGLVCALWGCVCP